METKKTRTFGTVCLCESVRSDFHYFIYFIYDQFKVSLKTAIQLNHSDDIFIC